MVLSTLIISSIFLTKTTTTISSLVPIISSIAVGSSVNKIKTETAVTMAYIAAEGYKTMETNKTDRYRINKEAEIRMANIDSQTLIYLSKILADKEIAMKLIDILREKPDLICQSKD